MIGVPDTFVIMTERIQQAQQQPKFIVLPESQWEEVVNQLGEIKTILHQKAEDVLNSTWIESVTARKMLGVSQKTWQDYRNRRVLGFAQYGRKIYVKKTDLMNFMKEHEPAKEA